MSENVFDHAELSPEDLLDPATLVPGDLIVAGGGRVLVVGFPQSHKDSRGKIVFTVDTVARDETAGVTVLGEETVWHRDLFDPSRYEYEVAPTRSGLQEIRALTRNGVKVGALRRSLSDGSIVEISPASSFHPLHALLLDQARRVRTAA